MSQTILLRRSATPLKVPAITDLQLGEIGINTHDGKMYIKKNDGSDSIVQIGGGTSGGTTAAYSVEAASFNAVSGTPYFVDVSASPVTVTLPATPLDNDTVTIVDYKLNSTVHNITIARNGHTISEQAADLVLDYNGVSVQLVYMAGNWVIADSGTINNKGYITTTEYVATAGQTVFNVTYPTSESLLVFVNGIQLSLASGDYTATSGTSITLALPSTIGDQVKLVSFANIGSYPNINVQEFTAMLGQTSIDFVYYAAGGISALQVFKNGIQLQSSDYIATDNATVNFVTPLALNDKIKLISIRAGTISTVNNKVPVGMFEHSATIIANYSITAGNNAISAGPITIANGAIVSVPATSTWQIV